MLNVRMGSPGVRGDWQIGKKKVNERAQHLLETEQWSDCRFIVGTEPNQKVCPRLCLQHIYTFYLYFSEVIKYWGIIY